MADTLMTADVPGIGSAPASQAYGIFLHEGGGQVLVADSIINLDYQNDSRMPTYPQMSGGFQTYSKVNTPFDIRIRLTKMGTVAERGAFLAEVEAAAKGLDLYDIVTPEKTYLAVNIEKIAHVHNAQSGATKMTIDLVFLEIRNTVTASFADSSLEAALSAPFKPVTNAATKTGGDPVNIGTVQTGPPTRAQVNAIRLSNAILEAPTIVP